MDFKFLSILQESQQKILLPFILQENTIFPIFVFRNILNTYFASILRMKFPSLPIVIERKIIYVKNLATLDCPNKSRKMYQSISTYRTK